MPQRPRTHVLEEESRQAFRAAVPTRWVIRDDVPDYGNDFRVDVVEEDGTVTGRSFFVQLKATDEEDIGTALGSVRFPRETADLYRSQQLPTLVVRYHARSGRLFARWFHAYNPHVAREGVKADAKSIRFQFYEQDQIGGDVAERLDAGLRGFLRFRSPELLLPLPVAVVPTAEGVQPDGHATVFALRQVLEPVSALVTLEVRNPSPEEPSITLEPERAVVALADVASVTLDRKGPAADDVSKRAADLACALAVALTYVGQANLAAQIAAAVAASGTVMADPDVAFTLAGAMFRSQRVREAIDLADALDAADDEGLHLAAFSLLSVLLAKRGELGEGEREAALAGARRRLERRQQRGDDHGVAAEAYSLGMLHKRLRRANEAVEYFRTAAEKDPTYEERDYFHADFAGALFEAREYQEADARYARAIELGKDGINFALRGDALIFLGRYAEARDQLATYLNEEPGPEAAEWRLKARTLDLIIDTVGDAQHRDAHAARDEMNAWNFEDGPDLPFDEAWGSCETALAHDACCGEAWFRLGILAIYPNEDPADGAAFSIAGAALTRHSLEQWNNAALCVPAEDEQTLRDVFYAGYHLNGNAFVEPTAKNIREAEHRGGQREQLIDLLDQAVVAADNADDGGFIMRHRADDGRIHEVEFGREHQAELAEPPTPANVSWQTQPAELPRRKPKKDRNKRPGKTHGRAKKSKRKKRK